MKAMNSSKKNTATIKYEEIMKKEKKVKNFLYIRSVDWQNGENFEIFTLLKNVQSGTTSTDSCLISPNA